MDKPLKIRLHVLSPIHIGCGDVYEPTSFVIDDQKKKLIEFDPLEFVKSLKPQELAEFSKTATGDNLLAVFKTIKRLYKPAIKGREVEITDYLVSHYKKILGMGTFEKNAVINQFTINKTAFNPQHNMPYIPGTSLKGALRTAYLNAVAKVKGISNFKGKSDELESCLLERQEGKLRMTTDPFRMVKVSDLLPVESAKTKIVYAINRKKQKSDRTTLAERGGVYQIFEVIQPGAVFDGIININAPLNSSGIRLPVTADDLMASLNKFYVPLLENEIKTLKGIDISVPLINEINGKFKGKINKTAFIVSIGRHSGAEAVTIEGNRLIKIKGRGNEFSYKDHATTIWLASETPKPANNNGLIPFGWAVLEVA
jgi:CRISPR-associated protein Csm5